MWKGVANLPRALLIIDMLHDFISPQGKLYCGENTEKIVPFIQGKIKEFQDLGEKIIFICDCHQEDDQEFSKFPPHCLKGEEGSKIIPELTLSDQEKQVVYKTRYSGFFQTNLEEMLQGMEEVHLVGVCTNICVFFTAEELCNRDIKTIVYQDGVASFNPQAHQFALEQMKNVLGVELR